MKKNVCGLISLTMILAMSSVVLGAVHWTENFDDQASGTYGSTEITINGREWTRSDAGNFSYCNTNMGSYGFTINDDKSGAHITTPSVNTCGTVSFKYAYINGNSTNVFLLQKSTNGSDFTTIDTHELGESSNLSWVSYSFDVNESSSTSYIRILSDDQDAHLFIDDFSITDYSADSPTITTSESALTGFGYVVGSGPSSEQSFTISGSDLTDNISITPPTNYEISTGTGGSFSATSPITLTQSSGSVSETTIYVRLKSGLSIASYNNEVITASSTDADNKTVTCSGTVEAPLPNAWINEIHYDNDGTDVREGVEIVIENPGNYTLSNFTVTLYNGNGGASYDSQTLNNFTVGSSISDFTIYYDTTAATWNTGIQNGPDGIALSYDGTLIQFLSYEGSFAATDGPANGITSTDIGVSEYSVAEGLTLQLTGNGTKYSDFTWSAGLTQTWGAPNNAGDQSLPVELDGFNAVPGNSKVTLCWTTESETENLGFNLYRGVDRKSFIVISDQLIPGHGSTSEKHEYSYVDKDVVNGVTYTYKIEDVDYSGTAKMHDIIATATPSGKEESTLAEGFRLQPCFPNPFNPETTLRFELGEAADVSVQVYDVLGNLVTTLSNSAYQPGGYSLSWNGRDSHNRLSATGIYFLQISSSIGFNSTQKVIFLR